MATSDMQGITPKSEFEGIKEEVLKGEPSDRTCSRGIGGNDKIVYLSAKRVGSGLREGRDLNRLEGNVINGQRPALG